MYMVTVNYRGALNIGLMREKFTLGAAIEYGRELTQHGTVRIYELFQDKPPVLQKGWLPK